MPDREPTPVPELIAALGEHDAKMTPGPWYTRYGGEPGYLSAKIGNVYRVIAELKDEMSDGGDMPNTRGIAYLRNHLGEIADRLEVGEQELKEARALTGYKNDTANTFMNQVRKLQARVADLESQLDRLRSTANAAGILVGKLGHIMGQCDLKKEVAVEQSEYAEAAAYRDCAAWIKLAVEESSGAEGKLGRLREPLTEEERGEVWRLLHDSFTVIPCSTPECATCKNWRIRRAALLARFNPPTSGQSAKGER